MMRRAEIRRGAQLLLLACVWAGAAQAADVPAKGSQTAPLLLDISSDRGSVPVYAPGEDMKVIVQTSAAANVACFLQDGAGRISRIFPNRHQPSPAVAGQTPIQVPAAGMSIRQDRPLAVSAVRCFASASPPSLSAPLGPDMEPLRLPNLEAVSKAYAAQAPDAIVATMVVATTR